MNYIPTVKFHFAQYSDGVICWGLSFCDPIYEEAYDEELGPFPDFQAIEDALNVLVRQLAFDDGLPKPSTIRLRTLPKPALDPLVRTPSRAWEAGGAAS